MYKVIESSQRARRRPSQSPPKKKHYFLKFVFVLVLAIIVGAVIYLPLASGKEPPAKKVSVVSTTAKTTATTQPTVNMCAGNQLAKLVIVSISQRHTWACQGSSTVLSTPVITGDENEASDLTPTGTYQILKKETNLRLIGCDTANPSDCWNDYVNYDAIFLYNQYGYYAFHDATWRTANDFGNISPYSSNASHGCVETPLAAMTWLYSWLDIGTEIRVQA